MLRYGVKQQRSVKRKMIKTNLLAVEMFQEGFMF